MWYRNLAIVAFAAAAILLAAYFGACSTLVPGDTGGAHEGWALVFAVIFAAFGVYCWRKRGGPVT